MKSLQVQRTSGEVGLCYQWTTASVGHLLGQGANTTQQEPGEGLIQSGAQLKLSGNVQFPLQLQNPHC